MVDINDPFSGAFDSLIINGDKPIPVNFLDPAPKTEEQKAADAASQAATDAAVAAAQAKQAPAPGAAQQPTLEPGSEIVPPVEGEPQAQPGVEIKRPAAQAGQQAQISADDLANAFERVAQKVAPPRPTQQPAPQQRAPLVTQEEAAFLDNFGKEYPEFMRVASIISRVSSVNAAEHVMREVSQVLVPLKAEVDSLTDTTQLGDLRSQVPDYDRVYEPVLKWVNEQPGYLRAAYQHVIASGEASEVVDLIGRWRRATGAQAPEPATPVKKDVELSPAAMQAVARLAPVPSKRTVAVAQADPQDFEGAFSRFAEMEKTP